MKSGAGTAYYDAISSRKRKILEKEFLEVLEKQHGSRQKYEVTHDYIACIAQKA